MLGNMFISHLANSHRPFRTHLSNYPLWKAVSSTPTINTIPTTSLLCHNHLHLSFHCHHVCPVTTPPELLLPLLLYPQLKPVVLR